MQFASIVLALFFSGCNQATAHGSDPDTLYVDTWTRIRPLPKPLSDMTAETVNDKVYIFGGCDGDQIGYVCPSINTDVLIYDPAANTYETLAGVLPNDRYRHAAATVGTKIYLLGGRDLNDDIVEVVDVFDTSDNTWSVSFEWTSAQSDNMAFVLDGKVYAIGGYDAAYEAQDETDIFDPDEGWILGSAHTTIAAMTAARGDFAVVQGDDDLVYAFGGWSDANGFCVPLTSAEVYDPAADTWTALPDLAVGRGDKAAGLLHGRVFAVGGEGKASCDDDGVPTTAVTDVEVYDPEADDSAWEVVAELPEEAFRFAAATWQHTIYVFGGQGTARFCAQHNATCNPLTNATWGFTETYDHDHGGLSPAAAAGVALLCVAAAAGLAWAVYYRQGLAARCGGRGGAGGDAQAVEVQHFKAFQANEAGDFEPAPAV